MYNDVICLVSLSETSDKDEYGDPVMEETRVEVMAKKISIGQKEFYQAQTSGLKPELKFVLPDYLDYSEQELLDHDNMRYKVLRTYRNDRNEMEIICYGGVRHVSTQVGS